MYRIASAFGDPALGTYKPLFDASVSTVNENDSIMIDLSESQSSDPVASKDVDSLESNIDKAKGCALPLLVLQPAIFVDLHCPRPTLPSVGEILETTPLLPPPTIERVNLPHPPPASSSPTAPERIKWPDYLVGKTLQDLPVNSNRAVAWRIFEQGELSTAPCARCVRLGFDCIVAQRAWRCCACAWRDVATLKCDAAGIKPGFHHSYYRKIDKTIEFDKKVESKVESDKKDN